MTYSIRRQLLTYLMASLLLSSMLIGTVTYFGAAEEINELYEKNMQQLADVILAQFPYKHPASFAQSPQDIPKNLHGEQAFLIQLWNQEGLLIYSSHPAIIFPFHAKKNKGRIDFEGQKWRYYSKEQQGITVQLSQRVVERQKAIIEISSQFILPLLLQIPLLSWLIWTVVRYSLKPLHAVLTAIEKRHSGSLHPLQDAHIPLEIKPLVSALNDLLARLNESIQAQRRFTADAVHELRTPLTAVQLQLDMLKRSRSEQEQQEAIAKLSQGVKRCIHLVRQLLIMAQQEPETEEKSKIKVNLTELINDLIKQFEPMILHKHMTLIPPATEAPLIVLAEQVALRTMLENVLDNAILYTPAGGKILVKLFWEEQHAVLEIWDNGPGIALKERQRVFDRFYRTYGTEVSGTGLGLSIVKHIADRHHISIFLGEGLEQKGLCFKMIFLENPNDSLASISL